MPPHFLSHFKNLARRAPFFRFPLYRDEAKNLGDAHEDFSTAQVVLTYVMFAGIAVVTVGYLFLLVTTDRFESACVLNPQSTSEFCTWDQMSCTRTGNEQFIMYPDGGYGFNPDNPCYQHTADKPLAVVCPSEPCGLMTCCGFRRVALFDKIVYFLGLVGGTVGTLGAVLVVVFRVYCVLVHCFTPRKDGGSETQLETVVEERT